MSWAEFVLRSIGFREQRKFEMEMTRSIAYQTYVGNHSFSKARPMPINQWWPIGEQKTSVLPEEARAHFLKLKAEALNKKENG